jgi:hypothetical protein
MASWRERLGWWREFRRLGVRNVRRRVDGVAWHAAKMRVAMPASYASGAG